VASKTKGWQKYLAVSCTHGAEADPRALDAMLRLKEAWKPQFTLHLGDAIDARCLRSGARKDSDSADHAADLADDLMQGLAFLRQLKPNVYLLGNHEARLTELAHSPNAVLSYAAGNVMGRIMDEMGKIKCQVVPYVGVHPAGVFLLGDTGFTHGSLYGVSAARDAAEMSGRSIVMGHTHRVAMESARTHAKAIGYNIGCGLDLNVGYAKSRRATLGWAHGFAFGEWNDQCCTVNLVTLSPHYRLP
jgi:predicted phosphodiesterase